MMKSVRRQKSVHGRRSRIRSPGTQTSDSILGRGVKNVKSSSSSNPKNVFWSKESRNHHSESAIVKTPFGKMPEWMTMQGMEHQQRARSIPDFLAGGHYGYQHQVYIAAADIFERLAIRKPAEKSLVSYPDLGVISEPPRFDTPKVKRQAYELAYETLKYQELLEEILIDSGYFFQHPTSDDTNALIVVMLFDFQNRKWTPRCQIVGETLAKDVSEVGSNLMDHRVRLAAALARCRVKNQSLSIDYVLPEMVRHQEKCAASLPQYAWVNTIKASVVEVMKNLVENSYASFDEPMVLLPRRGKYFRADRHCEDLLLFPSDQKEVLKCLDVVKDGMLVLQDKTSSLAALSVAALLTEDDECDLIHTDVSSGLTTAHLAIILHKISRRRFEAKELMYNNPIGKYNSISNVEEQQDEPKRPTVYAFGVKNDVHREQLQELMKNMGLKNVKLLSENFNGADAAKDPRFENVKVILCSPQCTRTAVANPVEFMLNEGDAENFSVLRDLSHGERHTKAAECGRSHTELLKNSLKFSSAQAVVYVTRSIHSVENEQVIGAAIKWQRDKMEGTQPFRMCPPTLPLSSNDVTEMESHKGATRSRSTKYLRMKQSPEMNGCFIAVLTREIDPTDMMTVKDMLRRAALKGLIAPVTVQPTKKKSDVESKDTTTTTTAKEVIEQPTLEKARRKSKVGLGKKAKTSSSTSINKAPKKSATKCVEAVDVDKMLEMYKKKDHSSASDLAQVNIKIEFHNPTSLKFSEQSKPLSPKGRLPAHAIQKQINSDVERILTQLSSKESQRG